MTSKATPETTQLTLHRSREYFGKLRAYRVLIDGKAAATIRDGQTVTLDISVTPEPHKLELRIDWCRSNPIEFYASQGPLDFECGSAMDSFPKLMLSILYVTIWYDRCLYIRPQAMTPEVATAA